MAENVTNQVVQNNGFSNFSVGDMIADGMIGGVSGAMGGAGKGSKYLTNLGKQSLKRTVNVTVNKGIQAGVKEGVKAASFYIKSSLHYYKPYFLNIWKGAAQSLAIAAASFYYK